MTARDRCHRQSKSINPSQPKFLPSVTPPPPSDLLGTPMIISSNLLLYLLLLVVGSSFVVVVVEAWSTSTSTSTSTSRSWTTRRSSGTTPSSSVVGIRTTTTTTMTTRMTTFFPRLHQSMFDDDDDNKREEEERAAASPSLPHEIHWLSSSSASTTTATEEDEVSSSSSSYDEFLYDDVLLDDYYGINDNDNGDNSGESSSSSQEGRDRDFEEPSLGRSIGQGRAVVCIPDIASVEECNTLFGAVLQAAASSAASSSSSSSRSSSMGRSRFSVSDPKSFNNDIVLMCDEILLRVLDHLDTYIPSVYRELFVPYPDLDADLDSYSDPGAAAAARIWIDNQPLNARLEEVTVPPQSLDVLQQTTDGLRDLYIQSELEWSEGEPAINVYESGGQFGPHKDHLALTVLIPLTGPPTFDGGGTGFWAGNRDVDENQRTKGPDLILTPPPGSALIFGGDVTHAGMPVVQGLRSVFVCSFSTKTPASSPDRLHGMQAPPQVSPSFSKGSM